ncbi:MAG TPA: VanZ family protein [Thermoanaerobaculia bacterium]|nr:VanZ family protein [Thermoanaerobaculia bacterium]
MPREILIRKPVTVLLLLATSVAIVALTVWMSGRSYENFEPIPFDDLRFLAKRLGEKPIATHVLALIIVPMIANILLFVPWGFFAFIALYSVERPTMQTYLLTILLGFSFTLGIEAWQYFLPSRVADVNDVIWNTSGTILGALLGHARLRVRFEFD